MHRYKYCMIVAVLVIVVAAFARYAHLEEKHGPTPAETAPDEVMVEQLQKQLQEPLTELPENVSVEDLIKQKPAKTLTVKISKTDIERSSGGEFFTDIRAVPYIHGHDAVGLKVHSVMPGGMLVFLKRGDFILSIDDKPVDITKGPFSGLADKKYITFRVYRDNQVVLIKIERKETP